MGKKTKYFLLFLAVIVLSVAGIIYYLYNKPALNVQHATAKKVVATKLYDSFSKDSISAKKNFANQVLEVSGTVAKISENQRHEDLILLKTNMEGAAVNCTLEGEASNIKEGDSIAIKGICNGIGEGDADLGIMGDVYLVRCYVVK